MSPGAKLVAGKVGKKIWWCRNCGYEVSRGGRCRTCGDQLAASPLAGLLPGPGKEVSFQLSDEWGDALRGQLIERLIRFGIRHRLEQGRPTISSGAGYDLVILATDQPGVKKIMDEVLGAPLTAKQFAFDPVYVLDGVGWAPLAGEIVTFTVFADHFEIAGASLPLSAVTDVRVEGHSLVKGGGVIGGGFGLVGAAEGIAAAGILNAITTRKQTWVTILLVAGDGWVSLRYDGLDETGARILLRPLAEAAFNARQPANEAGASGNVEPNDMVAQLERLARLHAAGALSDEEFSAAKSRLLGGWNLRL